ncbi:MAG: hypothetical protein JSR21_15135 [Proteobacteria bacterium]|nr:hypothetical protein [Pseudomonadota bacterium]
MRRNSAPEPKPRGWRAWVLQLTGALDALLDIGVALACIVADRATARLHAMERASLPPARRDGVAAAAGFWCRIAVLMKRTSLLCNWLEEGNLPPRLGAFPPAASPRPVPAERERPGSGGGRAGQGVAGGARPEGRRRGGDGWYARMRAEFARRPIEELLARLHRTLSQAARRADRPEAKGRVEELLHRIRRLLAATPGRAAMERAASAPAAARTDGADMRGAEWADPMDGAAFCA